MVVTGDRDAYQLVDDGVVRIMTTSRGITDTHVYDRQGVIDRYGIPPELVPDFIGLKGDTCDNIPGVPGIGDKTAADLLQRFGSLEGVLDSVDEISGAKRKENLTNHADDARISKQLATAQRDIPLELDLAEFVVRRARPVEAAGDVPRVRAARAAAPAGGGARVRRRRGPRTGGRAGDRRQAAAATLTDVVALPHTEVGARRPRARSRPRVRCSARQRMALRRPRRRRARAADR